MSPMQQEPADVQDPEDTRGIVSLMTIAACILSIGLIIPLLSAHEAAAPDVRRIEKLFILPSSSFLPEPAEHRQYVISTLALPFRAPVSIFSFRGSTPGSGRSGRRSSDSVRLGDAHVVCSRRQGSAT